MLVKESLKYFFKALFVPNVFSFCFFPPLIQRWACEYSNEEHSIWDTCSIAGQSSLLSKLTVGVREKERNNEKKLTN